MKRSLFLSIVTLGLGILLFPGCEPSTNRVDLDELLSPAMLPYFKSGRIMMVSSVDTTGQNNDRISIGAGKTATILNATGPGVITRIWIAVDSRDPYYLRRLVIRMYWDDEKNPSVNVPLGDFFGNGLSYTPYISQYLGMTSGGFVCYFPMPFEKSARIEVFNETGQEVYSLYYQISYQKFEGYLNRSIAYFHALWKRDIRTDYDSNYVLLKTEGHGHIVGANVTMQSYDRSLAFLEGNEIIYIDNELKPSIVGTGTEDYFSSGWYFTSGTFSGPYHGLLVKDEDMGRIVAYRHHIPDPIPFKKGIRFTLEHGQGNSEIADYSSTVYWYQSEPHVKFPPLLKAGLRIPLRILTPPGMIEAQDVVKTPSSVKSVLEDLTNTGPDWSKGNQLLVKTTLGDDFKIVLDKLYEPSYSAELFYSRGPDYGSAEIYADGIKVSGFDGYSDTIQAGGKVMLTGLVPKYGKIEIRIVSVGKVTESEGYYIGLDGINLTPNSKFIPEWMILGPFPNPRLRDGNRIGLDTAFIAEKDPDTSISYAGQDGKQVSWRLVKTPEDGYFPLRDLVTPNEQVVSYALTHVYSNEKKAVLLVFGSDDGVKVFINGKSIYRFLGLRVAKPNQDTVVVPLEKGWNNLMLKVENNLGGYAFYARFVDPGNSLIVAGRKTENTLP